MTSDKGAGSGFLAIDTAGSACSVAMGCGGAVLAAERRDMRYGQAEALLPMIERVVAAAGVSRAALDTVAVAVGPGGFTGIRVGLGAAHGIALALKARLLGVTSFAAVAAILAEEIGARALLVALDSRRDDLYAQLFDGATACPLAEPAAVLPGALADYVGSIAQGRRLLIAGDMVETAASALRGRVDIQIAPGSAPDARGVLLAAWRQIERDPPAGPPRPLYLRPPDVSQPRRREPAPTAPR